MRAFIVAPEAEEDIFQDLALPVHGSWPGDGQSEILAVLHGKRNVSRILKGRL